MFTISTRNLRVLVIALLVSPYLLKAQIQIPNTPQAQRYKDLIVANVPTVQMLAIDLNELLEEEEEPEDEEPQEDKKDVQDDFSREVQGDRNAKRKVNLKK